MIEESLGFRDVFFSLMIIFVMMMLLYTSDSLHVVDCWIRICMLTFLRTFCMIEVVEIGRRGSRARRGYGWELVVGLADHLIVNPSFFNYFFVCSNRISCFSCVYFSLSLYLSFFFFPDTCNP